LQKLLKLLRLPTTATAPFCPSEVQGSITVSPTAPGWKKALMFFGPGLLVSVGYMDPGNWATDIEAGAKYGYALLFVVLLSSLAAILLQSLSMRVGLISGKDLAQLSKESFGAKTNIFLWLMAEWAIVMTDIAEVLGAGLAFKLLLGCSLQNGILLTALDTLLVLGLKGKGFRQVEAVVLGLILTIGLCFFVELFLIQPSWPSVARGLIPHANELHGLEPWYLAIGILGATVMPHNLYLHSSIVHTRTMGKAVAAQAEALRLNTLDTMSSLGLAFVVNAAILILAGAAFYHSGHQDVAGIDEAYHLLDPLVGGSIAGLLFGVALLAAGQSSTFTGTIAGQVVMEGFMNWKIPCWQRRLITRGLALIPAYFGVVWLGDHSIGRMLVFSQVCLSIQLPFAIFPLLLFAGDRKLLGEFRMGVTLRTVAWFVLAVILVANAVLIWKLFAG
jgi:manganese transport protein